MQIVWKTQTRGSQSLVIPPLKADILTFYFILFYATVLFLNLENSGKAKNKTKQSKLLFPSCQWAGLLLYSSLPNPSQQVKILIAALSWLAISCTVSWFSLAICHEAQNCCEIPGEMVLCVPRIEKILSFLHPFPSPPSSFKIRSGFHWVYFLSRDYAPKLPVQLLLAWGQCRSWTPCPFKGELLCFSHRFP